jgi:signal transduction histidine kinase
MRRGWLDLGRRSERLNEPVLIWLRFVAGLITAAVALAAAPLSILVGAVTLWPMFFPETLRRQPTWLVLIQSLVLVAMIGWVDHVTNWEWSCFAPYAVPIVLVTWQTGRRLGFVFAFLCAATYWWADRDCNAYQTRWGFPLAVAGWWFYFSVLVVAVTALKSRRELDQLRIETLERTQALERQVLRTSEREQQRIGHDLHDCLGPQLAAIRYAATFLADELHQRGQPEAAKAEQICKMTADASALAHDLTRGIFPVPMDGTGLAVALKDLAETTSRLTNIQVSFYETGAILVEEADAGMHLYRIAQEAVNNAAKHGDPRNITIGLSKVQDALRLTVADDGKGLVPSPDGVRGMGLDSMRYRARVLGGELKIDFHPNEGTIVSCEMPNRPLPPAAPAP